MRGLLYGVTLATALGCAMVAGVFFAFSAFVLDGLAQLPVARGIAAMQSINRTAVSALFMSALFGAALLCVGLAVWAVLSWGQPPAAWVLAGSGLYLIGTIVVTIAANVPLNDALATVDPGSAQAASRWTEYVADWSAWNHVRGAAALGAAGLLTVALALGPPSEAGGGGSISGVRSISHVSAGWTKIVVFASREIRSYCELT